jgi:hypothetical protein
MLFQLNYEKILKDCAKIDGWIKPEELDALFFLSKKYIKMFGLAGEVGTWKGKSSYLIGNVCKSKCAKLITIDTFAGVPTKNAPENSKDGAYNQAFNNPNEFYIEVKKLLSSLPVEIIKGKSTSAYKEIKDNSLDFCFIDGDHKAPTVIQDIKNFLPKIKKNGIFLGHDYYEDPSFDSDVKSAVDSIIGKQNIKLYSSIWAYHKDIL